MLFPGYSDWVRSGRLNGRRRLLSLPAAARLADHKLSWQQDEGFGAALFDQVDQLVDGFEAGSLNRCANGGQRRGQMTRRRDVIEADHRHILWDAPPGLAQREDRAHGRFVIARKNGINSNP